MRLIDADAFVAFLRKVIEEQRYNQLAIDQRYLKVSDVIEAVIAELEGTPLFGYQNAPTVEGAKVVRCKDCKWFYKTYNECGLTYHRTKVSNEHFCSYGEKKKEGKTNDA